MKQFLRLGLTIEIWLALGLLWSVKVLAAILSFFVN